MDFDLSDDQVALRDASRAVLDDLAAPARVRAHLASGAPFDVGLWRAVVDQGWLALALDEPSGGLGLGLVEVSVVVEEVGRHVAPVPFLESWLALDALARAGEREWCERLVAGDVVGCVAWDATAPVVGAPAADVAVVVRGDELVLVTPVRSEREPAMDLTRAIGWLGAGGAGGAGGAVIGGRADVDALLDTAAVVYAADMLGGAGRALELAVAYAKDRVQFGKPIGSFQAVKHRLADALVDVEGMRSSAYYAAWCVAARDGDASIAASTAKTWCSDASRRVLASALQVFGGIGFTWEHDLHLFLKRGHLDQISFGDATFHRDRIARLLRPRVDAGESVV